MLVESNLKGVFFVLKLKDASFQSETGFIVFLVQKYHYLDTKHVKIG